MKNRNVAAVLLLPMVTFGIYGLVWLISTKNELNKLGAKIPTAFLIFIPIANLFWLWNYAQGVEIATNSKMTALTSFLLIMFLGVIGYAIIQNEFNSLIVVSRDSVTPIVSDNTVMTPVVTESVVTEQPIIDSGFVAESPVVEAQTVAQQPVVETQTFTQQPTADVAQFQTAPVADETYTQPVETTPEVAATTPGNNYFQG